jgi:hypothetical protein
MRRRFWCGGVGLAAGVALILGGGARAAGPEGDVARLTPEAARMYAAVRSARPGELKWQQIPWLVDLEEGIRTAREEQRPLLLFVSGDDPLEKC